MQVEAAKKLIEETFNQPYDLGRFRKFLTELTKGYEDRSKPSIVPDSFKDGIKSVFRVGKFRSLKGDEVDLVAVTLQSDRSLDRARTLQRNYIARYLKAREKDAALVAFIAPDSGAWRFSLVRRELGIKLNAKGKTTAFDEISPARRYSFLVGKGEKTHTAKRQLMPLLQDDHKPSLDSLDKAFNIETVTEEFFEEYRELFGTVKDQIDAYLELNAKAKKHFAEKDISGADFAKRLLGQIVFLYFLQKKGWLGVPKNKKWGEGSKTFLRDLYEKAKQERKNFFNEYLEKLFYEALNRDHSDIDHYHSIFDSRIPFLNGGLFDAYHEYDWHSVDIELPNEIFSKPGRSLFAGMDGVGILDVFDRYNFTVAEDEPLEREVAIDPEMLGKVFEKLLPVKDRGKSGTFYTPREIVHYMCQESLIAHLTSSVAGLDKAEIEDFIRYGDLMLEHDARVLSGDKTDTYKDVFLGRTIQDNLREVDDSLAGVKVCDPAIGSGAFPVGMMSEIVRARKLLAVHRNVTVSNYELKRETIHNSLYGVDLDSGAIEIAKLRLWLSLVVDEDSFDNIQALPNLDYKIMQGNSLLQTYEGISLFKEKLLRSHDNGLRRRKQLQMELEGLRNTLQTMKSNASFSISPEQTKVLEEAIKKKSSDIKKLERISVDQAPSLLDIESKASELAGQLKKLHTDFFRSASPSEKKKLRTRIEELEWQLIETSLKEEGKSEKLAEIQKLQRANVRPYFLWKLHFNEVFSSESGGFDIVIANPPYIKEYENRAAFDGTRDSPYYQGKMDLWYFFGAIGLDILKDQGIQCYIAPNNWVTNAGASKLRTKIVTASQLLRFIDFGDYMVFETASIQTMVYVLRKSTVLAEYEFEFRKLDLKKPSTDQLKDFLYSKVEAENFHIYPVKIEREENSSGYLNFVRSDKQPVLEKIASLDVSTFLSADEVAQGIVMPQDVVSKGHVEQESGLIKGAGIFNITQKEYAAINWSELERAKIKPFFTTQELGRYFGYSANASWVLYMGSDSNKIIDRYPNIKAHLDPYKAIITSDFAPYGLHRARAERFFVGEKIVSLRKCTLPTFTYTDFDCYVSQTHFVIKTSRFDMKYLTGVLNSKVVAYWLKHKGKMQGSNYQVDKTPLLQIPIPLVPSEQQGVISGFVAKIIALRKEAADADVSKLENSLNEEVYKLYKLTPAEIELIETSFLS